MCENAYLSIKNPKASRALKRALDPGRRMLNSLVWLSFARSATFGLRPRPNPGSAPGYLELNLRQTILPPRWWFLNQHSLPQSLSEKCYTLCDNILCTHLQFSSLCLYVIQWWSSKYFKYFKFLVTEKQQHSSNQTNYWCS